MRIHSHTVCTCFGGFAKDLADTGGGEHSLNEGPGTCAPGAGPRSSDAWGRGSHIPAVLGLRGQAAPRAGLGLYPLAAPPPHIAQGPQGGALLSFQRVLPGPECVPIERTDSQSNPPPPPPHTALEPSLPVGFSLGSRPAALLPTSWGPRASHRASRAPFPSSANEDHPLRGPR